MEEKRLTAAQVKRLLPGTWVKYHFTDQKTGEPRSASYLVLRSGKKKMLKPVFSVGDLRKIRDYQKDGYYTEDD